MARQVRDSSLDTRQARSRLAARAKPYFRMIDRGLHLGYRRLRGKPGTWVVRHYAGNQTYAVERIGTADDFADANGGTVLSFSQAQSKARERLVQRAHETAGGTTAAMTVRATVEFYLQARDHAARDTSNSRGRAEVHIYPKLGDVPVNKLTPELLRGWLAGLAKAAPLVRGRQGTRKHRAPDKTRDPVEAARGRRASANRTFAVLRAALNHAFREGKVDADPWRKVRPLPDAGAARVRFLSIEEAQRLVNACDDELRPLVQTALSTGCRYGELGRLRVEDLDLDAGTLHIRRSKSGKDRHVILNDEGIALFTELTTGRRGDELILQRASGGGWGTSHQGVPVRLAVARARIEPPISIHGLRHTWASHAVMNGTPLLVVAKNLGHADTSMVEKHYGHLAPSYVVDAIRAGAPRFGFAGDKKVSPIRRRRANA
jgi:integrase